MTVTTPTTKRRSSAFVLLVSLSVIKIEHMFILNFHWLKAGPKAVNADGAVFGMLYPTRG